MSIVSWILGVQVFFIWGEEVGLLKCLLMHNTNNSCPGLGESLVNQNTNVMQLFLMQDISEMASSIYIPRGVNVKSLSSSITWPFQPSKAYKVINVPNIVMN